MVRPDYSLILVQELYDHEKKIKKHQKLVTTVDARAQHHRIRKYLERVRKAFHVFLTGTDLEV